MNLTSVDPRFLDQVWPLVAALLAPALECNHGEATLDQVRSQIAYGEAKLLVAHEGGAPCGAAVIEFVQHPNLRVAHISYIGGRGIVETSLFDQVKQWCRSQGASEIRALCDAAHARLFARAGLGELYRMVGVKL